jgi:hypothetical protein
MNGSVFQWICRKVDRDVDLVLLFKLLEPCHVLVLKNALHY